MKDIELPEKIYQVKVFFYMDQDPTGAITQCTVNPDGSIEGMLRDTEMYRVEEREEGIVIIRDDNGEITVHFLDDVDVVVGNNEIEMWCSTAERAFKVSDAYIPQGEPQISRYPHLSRFH